MADLSDFKQYNRLADMLIERADKEQVAECARLLALNLAHLQSKFGDIPLDETLAILDADEPNEEQAALLANGMQNLVGVLGSVISGFENNRH